MLAYCNFYHKEIRLLGNIPGNELIVRRLCPPCLARLEKEVDEYVHELAHRNDPMPVSSVSCR